MSHLKPRLGQTATLGLILLSIWGGYVFYAFNEEKLSSSVVRQLLSAVSANPQLSDILGLNIHLEPTWYLFGNARIAGQVS